jgi:hypothetical protein
LLRAPGSAPRRRRRGGPALSGHPPIRVRLVARPVAFVAWLQQLRHSHAFSPRRCRSRRGRRPGKQNLTTIQLVSLQTRHKSIWECGGHLSLGRKSATITSGVGDGTASRVPCKFGPARPRRPFARVSMRQRTFRPRRNVTLAPSRLTSRVRWSHGPCRRDPCEHAEAPQDILTRRPARAR